MKLTKIKNGPYKDQYEGEHGVIYNEDYARRLAPELFKPAVKKSAKPKRKK